MTTSVKKCICADPPCYNYFPWFCLNLPDFMNMSVTSGLQKSWYLRQNHGNHIWCIQWILIVHFCKLWNFIRKLNNLLYAAATLGLIFVIGFILFLLHSNSFNGFHPISPETSWLFCAHTLGYHEYFNFYIVNFIDRVNLPCGMAILPKHWPKISAIKKIPIQF